MIFYRYVYFIAIVVVLIPFGCSLAPPATYSSEYSLRDDREDEVAFPFVISGRYLRCVETPFWGLWVEEIEIDGELVEPVWHPESQPHYEPTHLYNQGKELQFQDNTIYTYYLDLYHFDFATVRGRVVGYVRYNLPDKFNEMNIIYYIRGSGAPESGLDGPYRLKVSREGKDADNQ